MIGATDGRKARPTGGANEWEGLTQLHLTFRGVGIVFAVHSASQEASRNPASRRGFDFKTRMPETYLIQQRGRQDIDISSKPIDAHEAQLCEHGGDGSAAWIIVIEIEVERLLFGGKRHHPKNLVVEFLDDEHRPRKILGAAVLFAA
jgi:hypothetical protein